MKKSKKFLLWSIVPILGVSSGAACAIAGVTNQNSSTNTNNLVSLNSATPLARSTNETESKLKIVSQTYDAIIHSDSELGEDLYVEVEEMDNAIFSYDWYVNKGEGWSLYVRNTSTKNSNQIMITNDEEFPSMQTWTFRCKITNIRSGESITSEDIKFTITSWEGDNIEITTEPQDKKDVKGGQEITLTAEASGINVYQNEKIGYRWFEYDSERNKFTLIEGADKSDYTFIAPYSETTQTKKFVCRFYVKSNTGIYISESKQSIITINKSEISKTPSKTLEVSTKVSNNQASVRTNFYSNNRLETPWYTVEVKENKTNDKLSYQWYYVGRDGKEHLIEGENNSTLTPNKKLFKEVYEDNSNHKVGIVCKIFKNDNLDTVIDQNTNSSFYMNVLMNNRVVRVSK